MKTTLLAYSLLVFTGMSVITGCSNTNEQGCTDATALNYDAAATEDDGSCIYPFQGPQDPSFENFTNTSADAWKVAWYGGVNYSGSLQGGTGFLPSQGIRYMRLPGDNFNYAAQNEIWQDDVDFSHSTTMIFDYSLAGSTLTTDTGKVEILFTSNGTATLWSKTYTPSNPATTEQLNETFTLPSLPDAGRLIIRISYSPPGTSQHLFLGIDNIRVQ